jgi:hypothetical protein
MIQVKAFIERGKDGTYGVYLDLDENRLNYGIIGDGATVNEAIKDFYACYQDMKKSFEKDNQHFQEASFEFQYDIASFLQYYSDRLTYAGLQNITGVSQSQLSQYANGYRRPSVKTAKKIENSLHQFANEINQIHFC